MRERGRTASSGKRKSGRKRGKVEQGRERVRKRKKKIKVNHRVKS